MVADDPSVAQSLISQGASILYALGFFVTALCTGWNLLRLGKVQRDQKSIKENSEATRISSEEAKKHAEEAKTSVAQTKVTTDEVLAEAKGQTSLITEAKEAALHAEKNSDSQLTAMREEFNRLLDLHLKTMADRNQQLFDQMVENQRKVAAIATSAVASTSQPPPQPQPTPPVVEGGRRSYDPGKPTT